MSRSFMVAGGIVLASSVLFIIILAIATSLGENWLAVMRDRVDPAEQQSPFAGLISNLGIAMLGTSTLFYLTRMAAHRQWTLLGILTALLPTIIVADDLLMLHEGHFEMIFYASYALAGVVLVLLQLVKASDEGFLLMAAMIFLGTAMSADFIHVEPGGQRLFGISLWGLRALAEDLLKFIGYALFAGHLLQGGNKRDRRIPA